MIFSYYGFTKSVTIFTFCRNRTFLSVSILTWRHTCLALEVFTEERGIGEVQFFGNLGDGLIGVHQLNLDACDKGAVYPFLGGDTAGLADDGAQITLCQTHALSVVPYLVLFGTV